MQDEVAYAGNDPVNHVDPDGLAIRETAIALAVVVAVRVIPKIVGKGGLVAKEEVRREAKQQVKDSTKGDTLKPGPYAKESIPARGPNRDFTKAERDKINSIGKKHGCHSCGSKDPGTKSGDFVPDHQTPNKLNINNEPQVLLPHCLSCSLRQGGQVRQATRE